MAFRNEFKWRHYSPEIILWAVHWYLRSALTYRQIQEMLHEQGLLATHTSMMRWLHYFSPRLNQKIKSYLKQTGQLWRFDEAYLKIRDNWKYLYCVTGKQGNTLDFLLSAKRDKIAAIRFFSINYFCAI